MRGEDCVIYKKEDMERLMRYINVKCRAGKGSLDFYRELHGAGIFNIYSEIKADLKGSDE